MSCRIIIKHWSEPAPPTLLLLFPALEYISQACAASREHGHMSQGPRTALGRHGTTSLLIRDGPGGGRDVSVYYSCAGRVYRNNTDARLCYVALASRYNYTVG